MKILDVIVKNLNEKGMDAKRLHSESYVIESEKQAKYNDVRKVEGQYTHGVHNALKN
jgi:hypothetical protein